MRAPLCLLAALGCSEHTSSRDLAPEMNTWSSLCDASDNEHWRIDGSEPQRSQSVQYTVCRIPTLTGGVTTQDVVLTARSGKSDGATCELSLGPIRVTEPIAPDLLTRAVTDRQLASKLSSALGKIDPRTRYQFETTIEGVHVSASQWVPIMHGVYLELELNSCERRPDSEPEVFKTEGPVTFNNDLSSQPRK